MRSKSIAISAHIEQMIMMQKNIWVFENYCIVCMPDYTYGDYVYFNKNIDAANKQHIQLILD